MALVLALAKAFERVRLLVVWAWATAIQLPKKDLAGTLWVLLAPEASAVRRMCGGTAADHYGHLAGVKVELFASLYCIAGCVERSHKNTLL